MGTQAIAGWLLLPTISSCLTKFSPQSQGLVDVRPPVQHAVSDLLLKVPSLRTEKGGDWSLASVYFMALEKTGVEENGLNLVLKHRWRQGEGMQSRWTSKDNGWEVWVNILQL